MLRSVRRGPIKQHGSLSDRDSGSVGALKKGDLVVRDEGPSGAKPDTTLAAAGKPSWTAPIIGGSTVGQSESSPTAVSPSEPSARVAPRPAKLTNLNPN